MSVDSSFKNVLHPLVRTKSMACWTWPSITKATAVFENRLYSNVRIESNTPFNFSLYASLLLIPSAQQSCLYPSHKGRQIHRQHEEASRKKTGRTENPPDRPAFTLSPKGFCHASRPQQTGDKQPVEAVQKGQDNKRKVKKIVAREAVVPTTLTTGPNVMTRIKHQFAIHEWQGLWQLPPNCRLRRPPRLEVFRSDALKESQVFAGAPVRKARYFHPNLAAH